MPPPAKRYNSRAMPASDSRLSPRLARAWLPPALLILALSALFVFGGDRAYFYRVLAHNENSAKNLALAENLSPRHNFRLFRADILAEDGSRHYEMYGRFPIGGTALIKLAISQFGGLSVKLAAARTLALLMFCGAAVFACLAVARLSASRWVGLAAALIAFSSYYALYYSDEISNESAMDIFGVMLTFHGMVIFVQDGRFRQLLIKACAALLVGWHVYALLLAFIVFGLSREIVTLTRRRPDSSNSPPVWNIHEITGGGRKYHISTFAALIRSRYMILGAATLAFGIVVLGANLVNEYYAYGGETPPAELPSLASALRRAGARETAFRDELNWRGFAERQLYRAGGAALPYALPWKRGYPEPETPPAIGVAVGILAVSGALVGAALARRHWALWTTLALFGFFWAVPMRVNAASVSRDFEAVFYVGVPLALFGLALTGARRTWGERAVIAAALAAVVVFAASAFQIQAGELAGDAPNPEALKADMADYDAIREKTRGKVVAVLPDVYEPRHPIYAFYLGYYLAGSVLAMGEPTFARMARADFVISRRPDYGGEGFIPLTPENREIFLHAVELSPTDFYRAERRRAESAKPAARSDFDIYMDSDTLYYLKDPCTPDDTRGRFLLSVHPVRAISLPEARRVLGHDSLNFDFAHRGTPIFDGACMAKAPLPDYPIRLIETGKWIPDGEEVWRADIRPPLSAKSVAYYESVYAETAASSDPLMESDFDVYMEGDRLIYLKSPCAESDTRDRFFLSVRPVNPADLPENRRELGHDALNFDFSPDGITFANKCMTRRELPSYAIAEISTGQYIPNAGETWSAETRLPLSAESIAYYESVYEEAKSSGEPLIRSDFDVYKEGGALTYLKAPCAEGDTRGRFFLSVHPVDVADLPEDRRDLGHDGLNFDFAPDGIIFANKCMIRRELPDYPILKIETGQWIPGVGGLWAGEAAVGN